jgi:S1-C subfamily serine protease
MVHSIRQFALVPLVSTANDPLRVVSELIVSRATIRHTRRAVVSCLTPSALLAVAAVPGQLPGDSTAPGTGSQSVSPTATLSPEQLFAQTSPAVVSLSILDEDGRQIGTASGFVVEVANVPAKFVRQPIGPPDLRENSGRLLSLGPYVAPVPPGDTPTVRSGISQPANQDYWRSIVVTNYHVIRAAVYADVTFVDRDPSRLAPVTKVVAEDEAVDRALGGEKDGA